jgi:hypothetical protein
MTGWTALVRVAMKSVYFAERDKLPRPLDTDLAAGLDSHGHEERLPRETRPC